MECEDLSNELLSVDASSFFLFAVAGIDCACFWWKHVLLPCFSIASSNSFWVQDSKLSGFTLHMGLALPTPLLVLVISVILVIIQNKAELVSTQNYLVK